MSVATRVRFTLARRPWIRWLVVLALALTTARIIHNTDADLAQARQRWEGTQTVLVARNTHRPGDPFVVEEREFPLVAVPPTAVDTVPPGSVARHHLAVGEVVVEDHVTGGSGPLALAEPGQAVVAVPVTATAPPPPGTRVRVVGEGIVLAATAVVVGVEGDVAWLAVADVDAPVVADGVRQNLVSLVLVP